MEFNPKIFGAYDIRGTYPDQLTEELAFGIGALFIRFLKAENPTVILGRDARLSSPALSSAFARGVAQEGGNVLDLGVITTPMLYFAVAERKAHGGAMITASHNPNPYNGIKLVRERAIPIGQDSGLFEIRDGLASFSPSSLQSQGSVQEQDLSEEYERFVFQVAGVKLGELQGMKIALDAGNGTGGEMASRILREAGAEVYPLYIEPDGRFPNHVPDPIQKDNIKDLMALVTREKAHMGIALDGDADRLIFVTEQGDPVSGDIATGLLASRVLKEQKGAVVYDIRSSNAVREVIETCGGTPVVSRIGHVFIKEAMRREKAVFGGELSGHYFLGAPHYYEIPYALLLYLAKAMQKEQAPLSQIVAPFLTYARSGEINFDMEQKREAIQALKEKYASGKATEIDGLRVDFEDWWFLVRPSNTEPKLRLVLEAKTERQLQEKKKELVGFLSDFA